MNKNKLKNGMSFKIRKGNMCYIIQNRVYVNTSFHTLSDDGTLDQYIENLNDDMTTFVRITKDYDIMKVFDIDGKLIWERQEIDWTKIPKDTKVLVRNNDDEEWARKYFAEYKNGKFYCYSSGTTSWSNKHDSAFSYGLIEWKQCKLAKKLKEEKPHITWKYIKSKFRDHCWGHVNCRSCELSNANLSENCKIEWFKDNFDKVVQEYYSES